MKKSFKRVVKGVYLKPELIKVLEKEAIKENRSLSGQMSFIIESWIKDKKIKYD